MTIDKAVAEIIAPIISHKDLGNDKLLKKCLHGQTQNVNESLNNIGQDVKTCRCRQFLFKTAVASAVIFSLIEFSSFFGKITLFPYYHLKYFFSIFMLPINKYNRQKTEI